MNVQIIESKDAANSLGRYFHAVMQCGKVKMSISVNDKYVQAVVHNASNRAWKGWGKFYRNFDDAAANYRSSEARAMIDAARTIWNGGAA